MQIQQNMHVEITTKCMHVSKKPKCCLRHSLDLIRVPDWKSLNHVQLCWNRFAYQFTSTEVHLVFKRICWAFRSLRPNSFIFPPSPSKVFCRRICSAFWSLRPNSSVFPLSPCKVFCRRICWAFRSLRPNSSVFPPRPSKVFCRRICWAFWSLRPNSFVFFSRIPP